MKRILSVIYLLFFLLIPSAKAEEIISLPVILKDGTMEFAILEISDGRTTVNLLQGDNVGFHLLDWEPDVIQPKGGGVYQDSTLAVGRVLVSSSDANGNESLDLKVNGHGQNALIRESQDLMRLLVKARNYFLTDWQDEIVWIKAKAKCETNARYAYIINFDIPELGNPYAQPFFSASQLALLDDFTLNFERQHWFEVQPGTSECVQANSTQTWYNEAEWILLRASALYNLDAGLFVNPNSGNLFIGGESAANPVILRSTDDGTTWVLNYTHAGAAREIKAFTQLANGNILAGSGNDGDIIQTANDGGAWATIATIADVSTTLGIVSLETLANDDVLAGYRKNSDSTATISISTNGGVGWAVAEDFNVFGDIMAIKQLASGTILATLGDWSALTLRPTYIYRSTNGGYTWSVVLTEDNANHELGNIIQIPSDNPNVPNRVLVGRGTSDNAGVWISDDDGLTWQLSLIDSNVSLHRFQNPMVYHPVLERIFAKTVEAGVTNHMYRSIDGNSWILEDTNVGFGAGTTTNMVIADNNRIILGAANIYGREWADGQTMGRTNTCNGEVFVANKSNIANLTHIKIDDGGAFTDIFPMASFPIDLYPAVPADNDALYFGIDPDIIDTGPFDSLVFDLASIFEYHTAAVVIDWEYWNGAWVALSVQDGTNSFQNPGVSSVHWEQPSDWTTTAIDGVTALWVRAIIDASGGTVFTAPPSQQNRQIYTIVNSFVQVDDTNIGGDIPALMRNGLLNRSDLDGGSNPPELADNRIVVGLRSLDRGNGVGANFNAYINLSDEQNDDGIVVAASTNTVFAADNTTPTGRRMTYSAAIGDTSFVDRASVQLGSSIIRDYYGIYHIFLRAKQHTGSAGDIDVRLQIRTGTGGITKTTSSQQFETTNDWQLLDFGQIRIPTSSILNQTEIGDENVIAVQAKNTSGATRTIYLYDLVLIPVDEWALDSVDLANIANSIIGQQGDIQHLLDTDSLTNFKRDIRTLVKTRNLDGFVTANYNAIANGPAILQANADQRLWFLSAKYGVNDEWVSEPWIAHSIQLFKNQRYLGFRGDR